MDRTAVMLCGHGSRDDDAIREFNALAKGFQERHPEYQVDSGYLEFARPIIRDGLEGLYRSGARRIVAVPGMLFAAGHVKNDIPSELNEFARAHPGLTIDYARDLAVDSKLLAASRDRIEAAEAAASGDIGREDTLLLVVGRGTNDSDANSNIAKVTRMLWEGMGFGWAETAYSGVTYPLIAPALDRVTRLGFRRIIVFPYFLFTGILVKRIYDAADTAAARFGDIDIVKAGYLNDHPMVYDAFAERVGEIATDSNNMNCLLCKYREQIIGFEGDHGAPQTGHHHHVRGIGTASDAHNGDAHNSGAHHYAPHHAHHHAKGNGGDGGA